MQASKWNQGRFQERKIEMKKFFLFALVCLSVQANADQLFIRNRPFKGHAFGVGRNLSGIRIELTELVKASGFTLAEIGGNWVVHKEGETAALPADAPEGVVGRLFVNGKEVECTEENGEKVVSLQSFTQAVGGRLSHNSEMKSVDLNFPQGASVTTAGKPTSGTQPAQAGPGQYTLVNFGAPW